MNDDPQVELTPEQLADAKAWNPKRLFNAYFVLGVEKGNWGPFAHWARDPVEVRGLELYIDHAVDVFNERAIALPPRPSLARGPCPKGADGKISDEALQALYAKVQPLRHGRKMIVKAVRVYLAVVATVEGRGAYDRERIVFRAEFFGGEGHRKFQSLSRFLLGQTDRHRAKQRNYNATGRWELPDAGR